MKTRQTELVPIDTLKPHPRNYKKHPEDQLAHIRESLKQFGFYRNVVITRDNTILAGHGVVEAARQAGVTEAPVFRLDLDPDDPAALKVLALDNELGKFAETDDRALTELLKDIAETDISGLLGTGFDEKMLAALVMTTRPAAELADFEAAAEWVGMPEYDPGGKRFQIIFNFDSEDARAQFVEQYKIKLMTAPKGKGTWTTRWPNDSREDFSAVGFEEDETPVGEPAP